MTLLEKTSLSNEAPWVYIKGLIAHSKAEQVLSLATNVKKWYIIDFPELKAWCLKLIMEKESNNSNRFIYSVLLEFAVAESEKEKALDFLKHLKTIDRIRENYY